MDIIDHLKSRYININLHRPIIDFDNRVASFFLYSFTGSLVGYQQYRPESDKKTDNNPKLSRYYTYRKQPVNSVWGLESFYINDGPIFITEGIFDAARLTHRNQTAFATLCNNPQKDFKNWLECLARPIIAVCDNDSAGKKLAKFGNYYEINPNENDLGDSSEDYVTYLIKKYNI